MRSETERNEMREGRMWDRRRTMSVRRKRNMRHLAEIKTRNREKWRRRNRREKEYDEKGKKKTERTRGVEEK